MPISQQQHASAVASKKSHRHHAKRSVSSSAPGKIDFNLITIQSLRAYKRHFSLPVRANATKPELIATISQHFHTHSLETNEPAADVNEDTVINAFLVTARRAAAVRDSSSESDTDSTHVGDVHPHCCRVGGRSEDSGSGKRRVRRNSALVATGGAGAGTGKASRSNSTSSVPRRKQ